MSTRNLDKLFAPQSVVLIGASKRVGSVGDVLLRNLVSAGFAGTVMAINPHAEAFGEVKAYPDVASLPETPDLAIIATPPGSIPDLITELASRGTRAAVVITAGFGELGEDGRRLQSLMLDAARASLFRIIGPNCLGIMVPGVGLNASFAQLTPLKGNIAFVSHTPCCVLS